MFEKLYDSLKETPHAGQNPETVHSGEMLRLRNHKTCRPCRIPAKGMHITAYQ